jgi:hypothetical protein
MLPSSCVDVSSVAIFEVDPGAVRSTSEHSAHDAGAEPLAIDPGAVKSTLERPAFDAGAEPLGIDARAGRTLSLEPPDLNDV